MPDTTKTTTAAPLSADKKIELNQKMMRGIVRDFRLLEEENDRCWVMNALRDIHIRMTEIPPPPQFLSGVQIAPEIPAEAAQ